MICILFLIVAWFLFSYFIDLLKETFIGSIYNDANKISLFIGMIVFQLILNTAEKHENPIMYITKICISFAIIVLIFGCFFLSFSVSHYALLLRDNGHGGGISVKISFKDKQNDALSTYLILRTSDTIFTFDKDKNEINEHSYDQISKISYQVGGTSNLPYMLPEAMKILP